MAVRESDPPARSWFSRLNPLSLLARQPGQPEASSVDPPNPDPSLDPRVRQLVEEYTALDSVFIHGAGEQLRRFLWDVRLIPLQVLSKRIVIIVGYRDPSTKKVRLQRGRPDIELFHGGRERWFQLIETALRQKSEPWQLILDQRQQLGLVGIATEIVSQLDWQSRPLLDHLRDHLVEDCSLIQPFLNFLDRRQTKSVRPRPDTVFRHLARGLSGGA